MVRVKINKKKVVKKLSRETKIPPAKIIPSKKSRQKSEKFDWKKELKKSAEE
jgi:hypothetical protein